MYKLHLISLLLIQYFDQYIYHIKIKLNALLDYHTNEIHKFKIIIYYEKQWKQNYVTLFKTACLLANAIKTCSSVVSLTVKSSTIL